MTDTTTAMPAVLEDMDEEEGRRLIELEREVEKAMRSAGRIAGAALAEIRDKRLYRASHASFERYVLERHGLSKSTAQRMIAVATGETNGLPPEVNAIGQASARAAQRRHETLDQPPVVLDPDPEGLGEAPETDEEAPEQAEVTDVLRGVPEPLLIPPMPPPRYLHPDVGRDGNSRPAHLPADGAPPKAERATKMRHRNDLNRILAIVETSDPIGMAKVSTPHERILIARFAEAFAIEERKAQRPEGVVDPKDCDHPANRRIGNQCGKCGATKKAKA